MMSLRLDRFFGSWQREFSPDYTAAETGMDRFIQFDKAEDFIGKATAELERENPPARALVAFEVDAVDSDVVGYEPIWRGGDVVGFCTSGGYSHWLKKSIAFGLVPRDAMRDVATFEIEILGQRRRALHLPSPLFDPEGERLRG